MIAKFNIKSVKVFDKIGDAINVIGMVEWVVRISNEETSVIGMGETLIPIGNLSNFTAVEDLDEQTVMSWVIGAEGGDEFVQRLIAAHGPMLERKAIESRMTVLKVPFAGADPNRQIFPTASSGTIPSAGQMGLQAMNPSRPVNTLQSV